MQRVSATWPGNDPANWVASPASGKPSPGQPQILLRTPPKPIVVGLSVVQASDGAAIVRANEPAKITASFSAPDAISAVTVEYFVDQVESFTEPRQTLTMVDAGGGVFTAMLPGFSDRSVVRYRIRANRGAGVEVISPREDDAKIAPVGAGGALEAWHGFFVTPAREDLVPAYDVFVSNAALDTLNNNISQTPRRVTKADASGQPREVPYVAATAPQWNGTQAAVFCADGQVWDVQLRYHGGFTQRSAARDSYKIHFPDSHPFRGVTSLFETDKDWHVAEGEALVAAVGLPAPATRSVNLYINNRPALSRLEVGESNGELLEAFHRRQQRLDPHHAREATGELYKSIGNIGNTANTSEGPYTRGDFAPIADAGPWKSWQRFAFTYSLQNHGWIGALPLKALVDGMWAARGDDFHTPNLNTANARTWCEQNLDVDSTLTSLALLNWMGAWDDVCQNQYFWRRANGRWTRLPWDFDDLMSNTRVAQSIFVGATGEEDPFFGTNWFKDTVLKCFRDEYRQRLWELNNSLLDPENLNALGFTHAATFAAQRHANVNAQLGLGAYLKPARPSNLAPADGSAVAAGAVLVSSAFVHPGGTHAATKWEIRRDDGDYAEPVFVIVSNSAKTSLPLPFEQLIYGQTYHWRVTYLDELGHPSVVSAETSFVWGSPAPGAGALVLSEILAANHGAAENGGTTPDYIELHNGGSGAVALDGMSLTDDPRIPAKFTFPVGTSVPPGGYLVVWCDRNAAAPGLHAGFKLNASGQTVLLMSGSAIADSVTFGPQAVDYAIGRLGGNGGWALVQPSPGADNVAVPLGAANALAINEWMAAPRHGDDWFELYNGVAQPVALGGLHLTDKLSARKKTCIPALSFIAPHGFTKFQADDGRGGNHVHFKLSASGDSIFLLAADAATVLSRVSFGRQEINVSQGRLPDGAATMASFPLTSSPEHSNWLPAPVVVNEVLSHSTAPLEDAIELYNPTAAPLDIGGWWLSDDHRELRKFHIPAGTVVPANGYVVFYEEQFGASFALSSLGDEVVLSAENGGALTGYRSQVHFGAAADGVSFGRVPLAGVPDEFWPMTARTFGEANSAALTGPVVINEILSASDGGVDAAHAQFIELQNITGTAVDLSGWVLRGGIDFNFAPGTTLAPGGYAMLVAFDPADAPALGVFRATYQVPPSVPIFGPFSPLLNPHGTRIELARPGPAVSGVTPLWMVDRVAYRDFAPWPYAPGKSIQRLGRFSIGNDPANWFAGTPSAGADNAGQGPFIPGTSSATLSFADATTTVAENAGTVTLTVNRAGEASGPVNVCYSTLGGTAAAGSDFVAISGTLTFASGETARSLSIPLLNDNMPESDESFSVALFAPTGGAALGVPATGTITILDNDLAGGGAVAGFFQFATPSSAATEASAGPHLVTVTRTGGTTGEVSVQVSQLFPHEQMEDATPGADFANALPLTLSFAPGEISKTVTIPILDDTEVEFDERLRLALSNPDGGAEIGTLWTHDVILSSDDLPPLVTPLKAGFTGLINEPFTVGGYGRLTVNTSAHGTLTARLMADGAVYAFTGRLDEHGEFRRNIAVRASGHLTMRTLLLRLAPDGSRIDGLLDSEPIHAERNATRIPPLPMAGAGRYTVLLRDGENSVGSYSMTIGGNGGVRVSGTLGDGTPFACASALSVSGRVPVCAALYAKHAGFVAGRAQVAITGVPRSVDGTFVWARPPKPAPGVASAALIRTTLTLDGAAYATPVRGQRLLTGMTSGSVNLLGGDLSPEPPPIAVSITPRDQLVPSKTSEKLALQLNVRLGTLSGRFTRPDGKRGSIRGVVVQRTSPTLPRIEGSFPGSDTPGTVRLTVP